MSPARRGATALEFGIVAPVMLLFVMGLVDWSWLLFQQLTVASSATRGARLAAGVPDGPDLDAAIEDAVDDWLARFLIDPDQAEVTRELDDTPEGPLLTVRVELPYTPLVGLVPTSETLRGVASTPWYGALYAEPMP